MNKIGRQTGLIAYDTDLNIKRRQQGKSNVFKLVRMRTVLYAGIIALVGSVMMYSLAARETLGVSVMHDRKPVFVKLADGSVRNGYTLRNLNKALELRSFLLIVEGLLAAQTVVVGVPHKKKKQNNNNVGSVQTRELLALVARRD